MEHAKYNRLFLFVHIPLKKKKNKFRIYGGYRDPSVFYKLFPSSDLLLTVS